MNQDKFFCLLIFLGVYVFCILATLIPAAYPVKPAPVHYIMLVDQFTLQIPDEHYTFEDGPDRIILPPK